MAALHSMVHRMVALPLNVTRYATEKNRIIEIGLINGYSINTVQNIIKKHEKKKRQLESSVLFENADDANTKRIVMPYLDHTNKQFSRLYRDNGYQMVNTNVYTMQKSIGSAKDKIPSLLKSGIYEVGCQEGCPYKYYGLSQRNPTIRYGEHKYCIEKNDHRSGVAKHMDEYKHKTDLSNVKLVQPVNGRNYGVFECYEKVHIVKNRRERPLMNQNDGSVNSVLFNLI